MNSSIDDDNDLAVKKPKRFYFDHLDLDEGAEERAAAEEAARKAAEEAAAHPPEPTFSEEELEAARKTAFEEGRRKGKEEALNSVNEAARRTLDMIGRKVETLLAGEEARTQHQQDEAVLLAIGIVRKLMPGLAADNALGEIEHAIRTALVNHMEEQRLVIRVPADMLDALKNRIDALGENMGYAGKLILLADDKLGPGDCRVEWADGGAERNMDELYARIERAARRALSGSENENPTAPEAEAAGEADENDTKPDIKKQPETEQAQDATQVNPGEDE